MNHKAGMSTIKEKQLLRTFKQIDQDDTEGTQLSPELPRFDEDDTEGTPELPGCSRSTSSSAH